MYKVKQHITNLLVIILLLTIPSIVEGATLSDKAENVPTNKEWKITFNYPVVESSVVNNIYITNSQNVKQNITYTVIDNSVIVHPPKEGYEQGKSYTLHITNNILGKVGTLTKKLNQPITKPFTVEQARYSVVQLQTDGTYSEVDRYDTFNTANANLKANEAIMLGNTYVKIPDGYAITKGLTVYYKQPTFTTRYEYGGIATDTELKYLDATEQYVTVEVAGQTMYVKPSDVTLIPTAVAKGVSYYYADRTGLYHRVYRHTKQSYDGSYLIGEKPAFLVEGAKYTSTDSVNFYDANGKHVGESYSYFQYLSPRVPTSYTAEQLDQYIVDILADRQNTGLAKYANASTKSRLIGLGSKLKTVEKEQRLNALLILSLAIHESDYGMSCHAQNYNNLFGLNVTDNNATCSTTVNKTAAKYFLKLDVNIADLANRLNTYYLNPAKMSDFRYNGVALGGKINGMNVRYASDPYWGAKTAGHMYRIDSALGSQDYKKYQLGITTRDLVSVRTAPNGDRAYQYKIDGTIKYLNLMPITLSNTPSTDPGWHRLVSELPTSEADVYTVLENVRIVNTH
ncbi:N-acetylglucosaminidase [Lysinibacillus antri]|uniref:Mannosyl-glycoprotein endo-beta-N-acetylglucosamidase-like domain-containing protein n=1 Tax=Lysinibacillus antri TaxID=2498145 RepID=A0A432LEW9_9BACI|nr:glucosaminidase domain-containing protein [Lysinibacillus antri]RUL54692.1 hypothetical protein EK386_05875 [Lysinibacillus antri]